MTKGLDKIKSKPGGISGDRGWSDQIRSVAQSCPTLCDPMNRSTPGRVMKKCYQVGRIRNAGVG